MSRSILVSEITHNLAGHQRPLEGPRPIIANGMEILGFAPGQKAGTEAYLSRIAELTGSPLRIVGGGRSSLIFIPILIPAALAFRKLAQSQAHRSGHFQGLVYTQGSWTSRDAVEWKPGCGRPGIAAVFLIPGTFLTGRPPRHPAPRFDVTRVEYAILYLTRQHELLLRLVTVSRTPTSGIGHSSIYGGVLDVIFHEFWTGPGGSGPTF
jgi:hypothetical protein